MEADAIGFGKDQHVLDEKSRGHAGILVQGALICLWVNSVEYNLADKRIRSYSENHCGNNEQRDHQQPSSDTHRCASAGHALAFTLQSDPKNAEGNGNNR